MMMLCITRFRRLGVLGFAIGAFVACRADQMRPSAPPTRAPQLSLVDNGLIEHTVDVQLASTEPIDIGRFLVAVQYDTVRWTFVEATAPNDVLSAAHASNGRVLVAGTSVAGITQPRWATLRFARRDPANTRTSPALGLDLLEVGARDGRDVRTRIGVVPPTAGLR